jgi:spore germination protein GerM
VTAARGGRRRPGSDSRLADAFLFTVAGALIVWLLIFQVPRWLAGRSSTGTPGAVATPDAEPGRRINATLFYVGADGASLNGVQSEVPYGETTVEQAKAIITAQLAPAAPPLVSAVPPGTTLRALFITERGEAYVDFSGELVSRHPGGSRNELLTIYSLVDALTTNLPAVTSVQLLVEGRELETLAGHVDLRQPLAKNIQ